MKKPTGENLTREDKGNMIDPMAEAVLNGVFCGTCGEYMGGLSGYPRLCPECGPTHNPATPMTQKVKCTICGKMFKKWQGLKDHMRDAHNKKAVKT